MSREDINIQPAMFTSPKVTYVYFYDNVYYCVQERLRESAAEAAFALRDSCVSSQEGPKLGC